MPLGHYNRKSANNGTAAIKKELTVLDEFDRLMEKVNLRIEEVDRNILALQQEKADLEKLRR